MNSLEFLARQLVAAISEGGPTRDLRCPTWSSTFETRT